MSSIPALLIGLVVCGQLDPVAHLGSLAEELRSPARVAVTPDGTVLVSDPFNNHIARFDASGTLLGTWPVAEGPVGVAAHPDGRYFVSLRDEPRVAIYDAAFVRTGFLGEGDPLVPFVQPTDIDVATDTGWIYVVDPEGDRVYGFASDGSWELTLGIHGELSGQFQYPSAIAVDETYGRLIVADQDNFRIQVFSTSGVFQMRFGYRMKYLVSGFQEGWMPRTLGVEVDSVGRIYLADALMSTVRIFDALGTELGKAVEYGFDPGDIRNPCDLVLDEDGSRLYVVSTNTSSVEVYEAPSSGGLADAAAAAREAALDPPGTNACEYDSHSDAVVGPVDWARQRKEALRRVSPSGPRSLPTGEEEVFDFALAGQPPGYNGVHMIDGSIICGRCHGITGQPGEHVGLVEGQSVLCMSCHIAGGQALHSPSHELDLADPFGTNPNAADGRGRSHAWGVPVVNTEADSVGPLPGGEMELHLDGGYMKCTTCHNQHDSLTNEPYLRVSNDEDAMCKECHAPRDKGPGEDGTHGVGFDYPGGVGEFPAADELAPLVLKEGKVECTTCHAPHYADSGGANDGEGDGMLLRDGNDGTLCRTCHTEHVIHDVRGDWQPTCVDCHGIHDPGNENLSLVSRDVGGTPVTFQDNDLGSNGLHDFIHSNHAPASFDGVCEVCHTDTGHHGNSPNGDHDHYTDVLCTDCHTHDTGFLPSGGSCTACHGQPPDGEAFPNTAGSHGMHMSDPIGPGIASCFVCHDTFGGGTHQNGQASFASGVDGNADDDIDLSETDVCDACHSPDGAFDGVNDPDAGAKANWAEGVYTATSLKAGKALWCAGCHDEGTSEVQGVSAPSVAGDGATWGYYATGHGRSGAVPCTHCHDATLPHFDGAARTYSFDSAYYDPGQSGVAYASGYRLRNVDGEVPLMIPADNNVTFGYNAGLMKATAFRLCFECHDPSMVLDDTPGDGIDSNFRAGLPNPPRDYSYAWGGGSEMNEHVSHIMNYAGPFADSDWDTGTVAPGGMNGRDTMTACFSCHNVHGAGGIEGSSNKAMIRDGTLAGRPGGYGFSYVVEDVASGGYPMVTSAGATQSTSVGAIFRYNTEVSNMCGGVMCHDNPTPPAASSYDASGSSWGTYLEYYREPVEIAFGCTNCHAQAMDNGDNVPPGGRRAVVPKDADPNDFGNTSHHVRGDVQNSDCVVCHEMSQHKQGHVRLKDPDDSGTVYVHDQASPAELEAFCLNCHDLDGAVDGPGMQPFSDGATVPNVKGTVGSAWEGSVHEAAGRRCPDCHTDNAHGSDNIKLLQAPTVDALCYNCHTEGVLTNNAISGPGLADDIEEAFSFGSSSKHDMGSSFTIGADTFSLQCTSCHNPHVVTGKYWGAASGVTPITRPDFSNPTKNPRAMGTTVWGAGSGEKMNDYAGGGTYRTPNGDSFSGSQLPDYNTFCDDCHEPMPDPSSQAGAHGQLHFSGDPHGLSSANVPDGGDLCPNWYTCGKGVSWDGDNCTPDDEGGSDAECWPVIPRGRGEQIWSKGPYSQEERITGANFVLSCTDCHEAHGSSIQSMIRTNPNSGTGHTNWLTMCSNCHYFNSDFHAGMSCGNASCHGANAEHDRMWNTGTDTLHRMGQRYGDPSTRTFNPDLVVDMRFENNLKDSASFRLDGVWSLNRPDSSQHTWCAGDPAGTGSFVTGRFGNAIEISNQPVEVGTEDCDWSTLENSYNDLREDNGLGHRHGGHGTWKYTEMKYNMTLEAWVYPTDDTNERKIIAKHTYWSGGYAFVLRQFDGSLRVGLLTNINGGSGTDDCGGLRGAYSAVSIPLSKWTHVAATYDAAGPDGDPGDGAVGRIRIFVNGEDVTTSLADVASCYAQPGPGEDAMYPNSEHNDGDSGSWWASALSVGGLNWSDTNANFVGRLDEVKIWNITQDPAFFDMQIAPAIARVEAIAGYSRLFVSFSEGVYANTDGTGNLEPDDFNLLDADNGRTITSVTHVAGDATAILFLNVPLDNTDDIGTDTLAASSNAIYDNYGIVAATNAVTMTALAGMPVLQLAGAVEGHDKLAVQFLGRTYGNPNATGALGPADFVFVDAGAGKSVIGVDHAPGRPNATVTLDGPIDAADIGITGATLGPAGNSIFGADGLPASSADVVRLSAGLVSSIASVQGIAGGATLKVTFKSQVSANDNETGALQPGDFVLVDVNGNNDPSRSILSVAHSAGNPVAILTLSEVLDATVPNPDTLAPAADAIFGPSNGNFPLSTAAVAITAQPAPSLTRVEGAVTFDQLFVSFSEGVYAENDGTGALQPADFDFTDVNLGGAGGIIGVDHVAGDSGAIITLDTTLIAGDLSAPDTLAALTDEIFNSIGNPVGASAVELTGNDCPAWGAKFPIEDEPQYSSTTNDETGLLVGDVGNATFAFPDTDNDWFNGDEGQDTYVEFVDAWEKACLNSPRAITIEARVRPTEVDRGVGDNTFNRVFERRRTILVTILNTDYRGDDIPSRAGKASIEVKYRVDTASRHSCPHPQWPDDPYVGNDTRMHQISSDIEQFPLVNGHWYAIKVVFNSDKSDVPGSNGTPVDIFLDDEGADGLNSANPTPLDPTANPDYEQWPSYVNASVPINMSSSCKWGALPGDVINLRPDSSHIGANQNHTAQHFEGQIDWVTWQPVADYTGVAPPN